MSRFFLSLLLCCSSSFCFSQNNSSIDFIIRNLGINVDGHFNSFTINAELNTGGELISIKGKIKVASIKTGIESRDEHLLKADYFNAENFEYITLESKAINKKSDIIYEVVSNITIKGKTKGINVIVNYHKINNQYKILSSFEINRLDFDIGSNSLVMGKTVKINVVHYQDL